MAEDIDRLIADGLHEQNLRRLINLCEGLAGQNPALYVTLSLLFRVLADEYDGQAIPTARYDKINSALQQPILDLIHNADGPAEDFLRRMDEVLRNFMAVRP